LAASFFGAVAFAVFAAAGLAAGSVFFVSPKQNAAAVNDRATATTAIRVFIMRGIPAEMLLGVNINQFNPRLKTTLTLDSKPVLLVLRL
jgi:hypothetical protein